MQHDLGHTSGPLYTRRRRREKEDRRRIVADDLKRHFCSYSRLFIRLATSILKILQPRGLFRRTLAPPV